MSLDDIRARADAATEGPWKFDEEGWLESASHDVYEYIVTPESYPPDPTERVVRLVVGREPDAEFIANARTDIPFLLDERDKLRAALDAVLALHGEAEGFCVHCGGRTDFIDYPCPTVQAITKALR